VDAIARVRSEVGHYCGAKNRVPMTQSFPSKEMLEIRTFCDHVVSVFALNDMVRLKRATASLEAKP